MITRLLIGLVTIVGTLLTLAVLSEAPLEEEVRSPKYEERILQLDRQALDEAYVKHVTKLYDVWVTDYSPRAGEPPRAQKGARNARAVYDQVMDAIIARENALKK